MTENKKPDTEKLIKENWELRRRIRKAEHYMDVASRWGQLKAEEETIAMINGILHGYID